MSDTHQIIHWALEFACPLRPDQAIRDPVRANTSTWRARHVAGDRKPSAGYGVFGDVCISSCTLQHVPGELAPHDRRDPPPRPDSALSLLESFASRDGQVLVHIPSGGFSISKEFGHVRGVAGLISMCHGCPANASQPAAAGCAGTIYQSPDSPDLETQLRYTIKRLGLQHDMADVFLPTNPIWYGLWATSPLGDRACQLIADILEDMVRQDTATESADWDSASAVEALVRAARIARDRHVPLHVSMAPPGHMDFGWYTIFGHCPRCKAEADLKRWQRYPRELHACKVCGCQYSPAATASMTREDPDPPSLREVLGPEGFLRFAQSYLVSRGHSPASARAIMKLVDDSEADRAKKAAQEAARHKLRERFIHEVLYAGLHPTRVQDPNEHGNSLFFSAGEFSKLLRRCGDLGVNVVFMFHESADDGLCLRSSHCKEHPEAVFQAWQDKGCNEWFSASIGVPDRVLDGPWGHAANP